MKPQIKNIQLVSPNNQYYRLFQSKFKTEKPAKKVLSQKYVKRSQTISWVLETITREWIKSSGIMQEERIIMYEKHYYHRGKKQIHRLFKELDYVLKQGNKLIIGELKVSNNNPRTKASKQTYESSKLIRLISKNFDVQIVWIDLCPQHQQENVSEFSPDFLKSDFQDFDYSEDRYTYNHKFKFLHIDVKDIFDWGVKNNLIKTPQLILATLEESELIGKKNSLKRKIKLLNKELKDTPEKEHAEFKNKIIEIEQIISIDNAKLDIIQKGWTIQNLEMEELVFKNSNQTIHYSENKNCNNFKTLSQYIRYIIFKSTDQTEIHLIDAEKVYHKLSEQDMNEIEHVLVQFDFLKAPIINNVGRRKFAFDYEKIDSSQKDIKGLIEFKQIIENSEPIKISLQKNKILIIDNYRMLHKITLIK